MNWFKKKKRSLTLRLNIGEALPDGPRESIVNPMQYVIDIDGPIPRVGDRVKYMHYGGRFETGTVVYVIFDYILDVIDVGITY